MSMEEKQAVDVQETVVLSKFEGDPLPENEFERIHIKNGEIVAVEEIVDGEVVTSTVVPGGRLENLPKDKGDPKDKGVE